MNGTGSGRVIREKFCGVCALVLGLFGRWCLYCLFTIGKCIVCVRAAVFWSVCAGIVLVYYGASFYGCACVCMRVRVRVCVRVYAYGCI